MKILLLILRLLVGGLFVFSGLVKLNDPVGTAIKMEEYFEVFASDTGFHTFFLFFASIALPIATFFCIAEVVLGIALLLGYRMRQTMWAMLALILFFTFLTFYSAQFNKVTDCGCFGDFIKLKPWTSFWKDICLLVPVVLLFAQRRHIKPAIPEPAGSLGVLVSTAICTFAGLYAIDHLPFIDWRPYHVGASIPANMKPSAPLKYGYIMERNGQPKSLTNTRRIPPGNSKAWR